MLQHDLRDDPEEALRLIKALRLPVDILAGDDADDEAREQVKCENKEKAKRRSAEAKRIAGGWYFVAEAASAIAHQHGWDDVTRLKFRSSMMEAAALGSLTVRDRSTRIPIPAGKLSTLACIVTRADVNLWLDAKGVGYRWAPEHNSLATVAVPREQVDPHPETTFLELGHAAPHVAHWSLKSIQRAPGYRWPLYQVLKAALIAGRPIPKPRDVLAIWKLSPPPDVQVMPDGVKYNDGTGSPKEANLKAIQQAIKNLLK